MLYLSFAFFHDHQVVICDLENELMDLGQIFEGKSCLRGIFNKNLHSFVGKLLPAMNVGIAFRNFLDLNCGGILLGLHLRGYQYYI